MIYRRDWSKVGFLELSGFEPLFLICKIRVLPIKLKPLTGVHDCRENNPSRKRNKAHKILFYFMIDFIEKNNIIL